MQKLQQAQVSALEKDTASTNTEKTDFNQVLKEILAKNSPGNLITALTLLTRLLTNLMTLKDRCCAEGAERK